MHYGRLQVKDQPGTRASHNGGKAQAGSAILPRFTVVKEGFTKRQGVPGNPLMMRMIFVLLDSDGDGAISLQAFQAAHQRIFKGMDNYPARSLTRLG
jgi:hypothetical protein